MNELVTELLEEINKICIEYYYFNKLDGIKRIMEIHPRIITCINAILDVINSVEDVDEREGIIVYTNEMLQDYMDAIENNDLVLMIDTIDFGLREVLKLCVEDVA